MSRDLDNTIRKAIAAGLLPAGATPSVKAGRPWPVVLLTGLGAWFAALPLLAFMYFIFYGALREDASAYVLGALILGGAVGLLRLSGLSIFVEQLAVPVLLAGSATIAFGLYRDLSTSSASIVLALLAGLIAAVVARNWLRTLLGASACYFMLAGFVSRLGQHDIEALTSVHVLLAVWLPVHWLASSHSSARLDSFSTGWVLTILGWLAILSGTPFLIGASVASLAAVTNPAPALVSPELATLISVSAAAAGAGWIAFCWPATRKTPFAMGAIVLIGLASVMPALGATLFVLAVLLVAGRRALATAAGFTAIWIVGAFYYQLQFLLVTKALLMVAAGAALGAIAWRLMDRRDPAAAVDSNSRPYTISLRRQSGIAISAIAVLTMANVGIWQKEAQIAKGHIIFIALAPVDPRSLMQGDYMRLNFSAPSPADAEYGMTAEKNHPKAVAKVGARGIATLSRLHSGEKLGPDELLIELVERRGRLTLAADAWYFKEGESTRWEPAKYGEFRVDDDGHAVLVGMRGAALQAL